MYPHRVESSIVGIDSSHRKPSGERFSVKYTNKIGLHYFHTDTVTNHHYILLPAFISKQPTKTPTG